MLFLVSIHGVLLFWVRCVCGYSVSSVVACTRGVFVFFFKQKTAYEMRISDWSSDVCSSDLRTGAGVPAGQRGMPDSTKIATLTRGYAKIRSTDPKQIGRASCRERVCQYV